MTFVRVLQTAPETLTHTFSVDEVPTDAAGAVTCTLKRLGGTEVASGAATHPGPDGQYAFTVPGQAELDSLTLDWSGSFAGSPVTVRDHVEVAGGFLFNLARARAKLRIDPRETSTMDLAELRVEVEDEAENIAGHAFVPRFERVAVSGRGRRELLVPRWLIRRVRAVSVDGVAWSTIDVSGISASSSGVLTRMFGAPWPAGNSNIILEYEHGDSFVPPEVASAAAFRLRSLISAPKSTVPERALSFSVEGGVYRLSTPGAKRTGIPTIDAVYERYGLDAGGFA